jgi:hypothetical protein
MLFTDTKFSNLRFEINATTSRDPVRKFSYGVLDGSYRSS